MDAVHETENRPFIGEVMSPAEFKRNWNDALKNDQQVDDPTLREALMKALNVPEAVLKTLEEDCSPSTLSCGEESMDIEKLPDYDGLVTLRLQKEDIEKREADEAYRLKTSQHFRKVCFLSKVNCTKRGDPWNAQEEDDPVPSNEVVLIVQVFKPIKMPVVLKKVRLGAQNFSFKIQAELAMLGCQTLRTLREKISCVSDAVIVGDFSDDPDRTSDQQASDLYKSAFFYIGNTFYNDMSDPSCRDYSEVIIEWAKDPKREIGPFNVADMADTKLVDLNLRLGYPYVYVHQGYCEHLVVFSDMRMHHPHDSQCLADYPVTLQAFPRGKSVFCMMCHKKIATWVTYENERVTSDPYFFCDGCFRSYNYTADNQKIGNFRATHFLDWNNVL
ncbi:proximal sequence element A Pbp49 [Rhipicephalus microplus]|uniref:snRNA-activating protein complex subunit 3 n=1 Tax=Rhipicephalus microplus TaxID=6941 RepID=A0A6M2CSU8_RHIMP